MSEMDKNLAALAHKLDDVGWQTVREAADRIEALEAENERLQRMANDIAKTADNAEVREASLRAEIERLQKNGTMALLGNAAHADRIEALEAALRPLVENADKIEHDSYILHGHEYFNVEQALSAARDALGRAK
jgi:chromosome segregation ATPase